MAETKHAAKTKTARRESEAETNTESDKNVIQPVAKSSGRVESFRDLAKRIAAGEHEVPPQMLTGLDRRHHVRATLQEDHQTRIEVQADGTQRKFKKLSKSPFSFFRGTALLFYRDMVGMDAHMPTVLALGDVHPENFGVMPNEDGVPIFSVNDFDEAIYAPFTWDMKRGAVGFWIAAHEERSEPQAARQDRPCLRRRLSGGDGTVCGEKNGEGRCLPYG